MNPRAKQGITLIELLTVIAVIGILALASIPAFRAYGPRLELSGTVRDLISDLRYIQQLAVTEQKECCIKFFPAEKKYQILQCGEETILKEKILPEEIQTLIVSGLTDNEVRYNPYGAVRESGSIVLNNTKNQTKTISIKPSGFVEVLN
jgi:prepilin-type N-terminal cleavage/methylation domain-containing protein